MGHPARLKFRSVIFLAIDAFTPGAGAPDERFSSRERLVDLPVAAKVSLWRIRDRHPSTGPSPDVVGSTLSKACRLKTALARTMSGAVEEKSGEKADRATSL